MIQSALPGEERTAAAGPDERLERAVAAVLDAIRQFRILADVRAEGVRLRLRRTVARFLGALYLGVAMILVVGAGVLLLVIGTVGYFRALFAESPGVGDLLSGALLLAAAASFALVRKIRSERAEVRRLAAKYAELEGGGGDGADR